MPPYVLRDAVLEYDGAFVKDFEAPPCKIRIDEIKRELTLVVNGPSTRAAVLIRMVDVSYIEYNDHQDLSDVAHFFRDGHHSFSLTRKPYHERWPAKSYADIPLFAAWALSDSKEVLIFSWALYGVGLFDADTGAPKCRIDTFDVLTDHALVGGFLSVTHSNIYFHGTTQFLLKIDDWVASADSGYKGDVSDDDSDDEGIIVYRGREIQGMMRDGSSWEVDDDMLVLVPVKRLRDVFCERLDVDDVYENWKSYSSRFDDLFASAEYHDLLKQKHQSFLHEICNHPDVIYEDEESRTAVATLLDSTSPPLFVEPRCVGNSSGKSLDHHAVRLLGWIKQVDRSLNMMIPQALFHHRQGHPLFGLPEISLTFTYMYREMAAKHRGCGGGFKMVVEQKMKRMDEPPDWHAKDAIAYDVDPNEPCFIRISKRSERF